MQTSSRTRLAAVSTLAALLACQSEAGPAAPRFEAKSFAESEWSEPVHLSEAVNSSFRELNPALSPDGLSLYVGSDRPGGFGGIDLYVSHRACDDCPWEAAVNLGPLLNTAANDGAPVLSSDGHLLFFESQPPGGFGNGDVYVSRRADPKDDFGWGPPVNLGPDVNTPDIDTPGGYSQSAEAGPGTLYFSRGADINQFEIYSVDVRPDGRPLGPAVLVSEVNDPNATDGAGPVRADGKEMFFWSTRSGGQGRADMWVSTRQSAHDPWSAPVDLPAPLNTAFGDLTPTLSHDGRTLIFASNRPGGLGLQDLWMSTRTPSGH